MNSYKAAGVDIDAGEALVNRIKPHVAATSTSGSLGRLGAFGGFFRPDFAGMEEPVLVSSVDGVGTKLKVAFMAGVHDTVGQCLVNHCVNDILCCGARPLFFLDYFATGALDVDMAADVIRGFTIACRENGVALVGGETAEMPGLYQGSEYDVSGTIVGVVDRPRIVDGSTIKPGDRLLALPSTGLHTNGYSLARKVLLESPGALQEKLEDGRTMAQALLAVHRSYLTPVSALLDSIPVKGISHITGGGLYGNTKRILPADCWIDVDESSWEWPLIFRLIMERGRIAKDEMYRAFNLGVGMVLVVDPADESAAVKLLEEQGESVIRLGSVIPR
jgi:phosphoribosylformylglycinamidine cyclo-ligase